MHRMEFIGEYNVNDMFNSCSFSSAGKPIPEETIKAKIKEDLQQ